MYNANWASPIKGRYTTLTSITNMFNFYFQNIGPVKGGAISLAPLTIICGRNNVGKTYISHAIYACLVEARKAIFALDPTRLQAAIKADQELNLDFGVKVLDVRQFLPSPSEICDKVNNELAKGGLGRFFSSDPIFGETSVKFNIDSDIESKVRNEVIEFQFEISTFSMTASKPRGSFDLTITYRKKEGFKEKEAGPSLMSLFFINESAGSLFGCEPYIATSERTGIALFQPVFDVITNQLGREASEINKLRKSTKHITNSLIKLHDLPRPVVDNI